MLALENKIISSTKFRRDKGGPPPTAIFIGFEFLSTNKRREIISPY